MMRDFVSYHEILMKRKFSLSANLELKFCWKIFTKIIKVIPEAFFGDFFFIVNRYNLVQEHKKGYPLL